MGCRGRLLLRVQALYWLYRRGRVKVTGFSVGSMAKKQPSSWRAASLRASHPELKTLMKGGLSKRILPKAAILLLLAVALVGLSALARHCDYLPQSNPIHRTSHVIKMNVVHLSIDFVTAQPHRVDSLIPPKPERARLRVVSPERLELPQIGLTVSLQHRSPPCPLA